MVSANRRLEPPVRLRQQIYNAHLASVKTMSSGLITRFAIVEVINSLRGPGKAELRHATFMEKVREHPGIAQQNFLSGYLDPNGQQRPCYYLPKREAELMVNC